MGIKGFTSNRKRKFKASKSQRWHRALKAEKKKNLPAGTLEIEDVELFSKEKLKNKLRNPKNNIKITGKKKRRLTKRLGHAIREKSTMEVEAASSSGSKHRKVQEEEIEEEDGDEDMDEEVEEVESSAPVASSSSAAQKKKKRRSGKKNKKKGSAGGSNDGDVNMEEDG